METKAKPMLVMAGPMAIWEQESGYAYPSITIAGNDIGGSLEELIQRMNLKMDAGHQGRLEGYWVMTLVRIHKDPPPWAVESAKQVLDGKSKGGT